MKIRNATKLLNDICKTYREVTQSNDCELVPEVIGVQANDGERLITLKNAIRLVIRKPDDDFVKVFYLAESEVGNCIDVYEVTDSNSIICDAFLLQDFVFADSFRRQSYITYIVMMMCNLSNWDCGVSYLW